LITSFLKLNKYPIMSSFDQNKLDSIQVNEFKQTKPFPWINPEGILKRESFQHLISHLPDISLFEKTQGYKRRFGQKPHDRYSLEYSSELPIDSAWHELVAELNQTPYLHFIKRLFGTQNIKFNIHWHYSESGGAVSPHCDSSNKIGNHIFYLNTEDDWKAEWGGQTLVLDDHGKINRKSAPEFSEFEDPIATNTIGNRSLIFKRTSHSWHGVKAIDCPDDYMRKIFIIAFERVRLKKRIQNIFNN
jgi:hypothetical protein